MTTVTRVILFTSDVQATGRTFVALGARELSDYGDYAEYALPGGGILGAHVAGEGNPVGSAHAQIVVSAFDEVIDRLRQSGVAVSITTENFGRVASVEGGPGGLNVEITDDVPGGDVLSASSAELQAQPLIRVPDVLAAAEVIRAIGLRETVRSDRGRTAEFEADSGSFLLHIGEPGAEFSMQVGDADALAARAEAAGIPAEIIDEAYGRTIFITDPGAGRLWINETQTDLNGYTRVDEG